MFALPRPFFEWPQTLFLEVMFSAEAEIMNWGTVQRQRRLLEKSQNLLCLVTWLGSPDYHMATRNRKCKTKNNVLKGCADYSIINATKDTRFSWSLQLRIWTFMATSYFASNCSWYSCAWDRPETGVLHRGSPVTKSFDQTRRRKVDHTMRIYSTAT